MGVNRVFGQVDSYREFTGGALPSSSACSTVNQSDPPSSKIYFPRGVDVNGDAYDDIPMLWQCNTMGVRANSHRIGIEGPVDLERYGPHPSFALDNS